MANGVFNSTLSLTNGKNYEEMYETASNSKLNNKTTVDAVFDSINPLSKKLKYSFRL